MSRNHNEPPPEALRMGRFINSVVQAGEHLKSGIETKTEINCRNNSKKSPCRGLITIRRQDIPASVQWRCQTCSESGTISGVGETSGQVHIVPGHSQPTMPSNTSKGSWIRQKSKVDSWLGSIVPAWRDIPRETIDAFNSVNKIENGPTIINENLSLEELSGSTVLKHARIFLNELASEKVKLTTRGNLNRKFVERMCDTFEWPGYEIDRFRKYIKLLNEEDFLPLNFIHIILKLSKLVRKYRGHLLITKQGKMLLQDDKAGELQALLFRTTFNEFNLGYLDGISIEGVFQPQIGFTIFLVGRETKDWVSLDDLLRLTVVPVDEIFSVQPDLPAWAFETRVINTLKWFGLLEKEKLSEPNTYPVVYQTRKLNLFDRFLTYDTQTPFWE